MNRNPFIRTAQTVGDIAAYPLTHPLNTALTVAPLAAGAIANNMMGNPIGGGIDAVSGNAWNLKADENVPVPVQQVSQATTPVQQVQNMGERAVAYQQQVEQNAQQEAYEKAVAMQLLNGYLSMIQQPIRR